MNIPYHFVTNRQLGYLPPHPLPAPPQSTCTGGVSLNLRNTQGNIVAPLPALLNAAQTVGVYPGDWTTQAGTQLNYREIMWRWSALLATIEVFPDFYGRSAIYDAVDPSERGALSFQMGQVFCALAADLAGVPPGLFMHLDRWRRAFPGLIVFRSNREPDFLSYMGPNSFQVWEAKCRNTNGVAGATLRDGFSQAWSVASVGGGPPEAYIATLARTDPTNGNRWELYVVDPGPGEPSPVDPAVMDAFFREYYGPLLGILKYAGDQGAEITIDGVPFFAVPCNGFDALLGLDERILAVLQEDLPPGGLSQALMPILGQGWANSPAAYRAWVNRNGVLSVVGESWGKSLKEL